MGWKFNPFTGALDQTGSGGGGSSYIDGEVATYNDLPLDGTAALNSAWIVREASGTWLLGRKPAGIYIRTATGGSSRDADYTYAGILPDVFSDANFTLYDDADSTKNAKFQLSSIATGTTRTITVPDANITLDDAGDSRTPTVHAASHAAAGSDPLFDQDLNTTDSPTFANLTIGTLGAVDFSAAQNIQLAPIASQFQIKDTASEGLASFRAEDDSLTANRTYDLPDASGTLALTSDIPALGTGAGEAAEGNHGHGNITTDGKLGSTAGLPVVTTTAGAVTTLALGTAGQILRTKSDLSGVEFADPAASGVTGAAASASDVLGVSGANITGVDANADRIVYWNNTSNKLAYGTPADAGAAASSHTHAASDITSGTIDTARLASGTANSGTFLRGDQTWAAVSGVTTGSVDNAILRADGTGGSTSQSSDINIEDATTSTENNVTISNQHSGQTNSSLVLSPKGTGAFILGPKPDGTTSGGNARGSGAVDLLLFRQAANQVASGTRSVLIGGTNNRASGAESCVIGGRSNIASNDRSIAGGDACTSSAGASVAIGNTNSASGASACALGETTVASGSRAMAVCLDAVADRRAILAHASGRFAAQGDSQRFFATLRCKTTTNAAVEMALDGSATYLTIPSGKVIFCNIKVVGVKSDGSVVATYERQYAAKNVAGTSSEVFAPVTIGTDNASSTSLEVATVDAGDYIRIRPTGIASETWRWVASVDAVEVAYGT